MRRAVWLCGAAAGLSLLIPLWLLTSPSGGLLSFNSPIPPPGRVLLVTAHPDDETIFFSPTISALRHAGHEVFLLCFTNGTSGPFARRSLGADLHKLTWPVSAGNYHGLGQLRQKELITAAAALQVS